MLCESPTAVESTENLSLFLDFDGTLVQLAERPEAIEVGPGLAPLLERVRDRLEGRLVLISGRTIADLDRHLGTARLAVSGSHGMERRLPDGLHEEMLSPADVSAIEAAIDAERAAFPEILVESKRFGVALHYRQCPEAEADILALAERLAGRFDLATKRGKMVVEMMPKGFDKGSAVEAIMTMDEFAGTVPVFIGDDITDEDGFRVVEAMGGVGILVGEREDTEASRRLPDVEAVHDWLAAVAGARP